MRIYRTVGGGVSYATSFKEPPTRETLEALDAVARTAASFLRRQKGAPMPEIDPRLTEEIAKETTLEAGILMALTAIAQAVRENTGDQRKQLSIADAIDAQKLAIAQAVVSGVHLPEPIYTSKPNALNGSDGGLPPAPATVFPDETTARTELEERVAAEERAEELAEEPEPKHRKGKH